jgi:acetyltransferase-like isoleucine patch superfamily enzyme
MSFLVNLLCGGNSQTGDGFASWLGKRLALRHRRVTLGRKVRISPGAFICPRKGAVEIGDYSMITAGAMIQGNVQIGKNCSVQNYTVIVGYGEPEDSSGTVKIGDDVRIAAHCFMAAGNHNFADPEKPISRQGLTCKPIVIEDDVWIAARVNIIAGVTIGHGSVIAAGSVVTKDIPPMSIAAGIPAVVKKTRSEKKVFPKFPGKQPLDSKDKEFL